MLSHMGAVLVEVTNLALTDNSLKLTFWVCGTNRRTWGQRLWKSRVHAALSSSSLTLSLFLLLSLSLSFSLSLSLSLCFPVFLCLSLSLSLSLRLSLPLSLCLSISKIRQL